MRAHYSTVADHEVASIGPRYAEAIGLDASEQKGFLQGVREGEKNFPLAAVALTPPPASPPR